jgi:hypothetical protein
LRRTFETVAGQKPVAPRVDLPLAANFLYMTTGSEPDPIAARALETYWVTVIDHGMNASTFTARVIASTRSDMVSAVTGAIGALKGPLHGGAPGPVLDMLIDIGTRENAEPWVRRELAAGRRIMGFGHRVYKVRDPRAEVLGRVAEELAGAALRDRKLFELARDLEKTVVRVLDEVKPGRNLKTNVRVLHGAGAAVDRTPAGPLLRDLRVRTMRGVVCARHGTARRGSSDPSRIGIRRPGLGRASTDRALTKRHGIFGGLRGLLHVKEGGSNAFRSICFCYHRIRAACGVR